MSKEYLEITLERLERAIQELKSRLDYLEYTEIGNLKNDIYNVESEIRNVQSNVQSLEYEVRYR